MNVLLFETTRNISCLYTPYLIVEFKFVAWSTDWHGFSLRKHKSSCSRDLTFLCVADIEEILMKWLHDPIMTKLCQSAWNRL